MGNRLKDEHERSFLIARGPIYAVVSRWPYTAHAMRSEQIFDESWKRALRSFWNGFLDILIIV